MHIEFTSNDGLPIKAIVISRGGKKGGKNQHRWNIMIDDQPHCINLEEATHLKILKLQAQQTLTTKLDEWIPGNENVPLGFILTVQSVEETKAAKETELQHWQTQNVYTEEDDDGQKCISLRWVIQPKIKEGLPSVKARLCARGFEEENDFRTDSPTCTREGIRLALSLIATKGWDLNSIDVKSAFLQGNELDRTVYVRPPKEASTNKVWKLNKCVYGLSDANRYWYLKVREELLKLGAQPSQLDQGIFYWSHNGEIIGIVVCFVDDIIWAGEKEFEKIIEKLKSSFQIGSESSKAFRYIGINLKQNTDNSIRVDQTGYTQCLKQIPLDREQILHPNRKLNSMEKSQLRGILGQLNWLAGISRPEISFYTCAISTKITDATIADIKAANKVVKFCQSNESSIHFPRLDKDSISVKVFSDASFNNLPNGGSQGGHIVFLTDKNNNSAPIAWNSSRIKRVAKSTLAAETLALSQGCDNAIYISQLAAEAKLINKAPIKAFTDNQSLFDAVHTTHLIADRQLRVHMSSIREMQNNNEIELAWISKDDQMADVLTKKGASQMQLMQALQDGLHLQ